MPDALVVLNTNDFMPEIARKAFKAAASRWACDFVEITEPITGYHHFWDKAAIPLSDHATAYYRVLQLDADMLVAPDCTNPFDLVPLGKFGVVSRVQPHRSGFKFHKMAWAKHYNVTPYSVGRQHLNAGFLLYEPTTHQALLRDWQSHSERSGKKPRCPVPEQFVLSCLLAQTDLAYWLPWQFNACRKGWRGPVPADGYIAHFHGPRQAPVARMMRRFKWSR